MATYPRLLWNPISAKIWYGEVSLSNFKCKFGWVWVN